MLRLLVCLCCVCFLFSAQDLKKEKEQLQGRKLWLNYDNILILDLEKHLQKMEKGEYSDNKAKKIIAISEEYFKIRDAKEKRKVANLLKKLKKVTK